MKKILFAVGLACSLVSANATIYLFDAILTGDQEVPANDSPGFGYSLATYDDVANTLVVQALFAGLSGTTTIAHIHAPTASPGMGTASPATTVPTFVGFPAGVTFGLFETTLDLTQASSFNPAFVTASGGTPGDAQAALAAALIQGQAYLNIHTTEFGGGEIRGFYTLVPEPSTFALLALGAVGVALKKRRDRAIR